MKNYFYKLNQKYIQAFKINVINRFKEEYIKTDESFLKILFKELHYLFSHLGSRTTTKHDIPKIGEYPDSSKFNKLINSISDDINKLYTGQTLIEEDLNNLMKFNSKQRIQTFENLVSTHQKILELYVKNNKSINGEFIIENDFQSADILDQNSQDVYIDDVRGLLTLAFTSTKTKPIDTSNTVIYFAGNKPQSPIYPNNIVLHAGSHWKIPGASSAHFVDTDNPSINAQYKSMMIDDQTSNTGVGWVEFESVLTELVGHVTPVSRTEYRFRSGGGVSSDSFIPEVSVTYPNRDILALKEEVGRISGLNKDPQLIYIDVANSLQGVNNYVKRLTFSNVRSDQETKYKLTIPFTNSKLTNEIIIDFCPIQGDIPKILWSESRVFSNVGGSEIATSLVPPSELNNQSEDGYYICCFTNHVVPSKLELMLTYGGDPWHQIPFEMTHYVYSMNRQYELPQLNGENVSLLLGRNYDIFVDSEPNKAKERTRALNVLRGIRT